MRTSPILTKLREETRTLHIELESTVNLLKPQALYDDYIRFLTKMYGFIAPIERRLSGYEKDFKKYNIILNNPNRHEKLSEDLLELGIKDIAEIHLSNEIPAIDDFDQAWGVLYVLEGTSLGSQLLLKNLGEISELQNKHGFRYLQLHGDQMSEKWISFCKSIDIYCKDKHSNQDKIICSAQDTLRYLKNWFEKN